MVFLYCMYARMRCNPASGCQTQ